MDSNTIKDKIRANEEKLAKKENLIAKLSVKLDKLNKEFEKTFGTTLEDYDRESLHDLPLIRQYENIRSDIIELDDRITNNVQAIEEINRVLKGWYDKLDVAEEKESKRGNPIIMEFLDNWEKESFDWIYNQYDDFKVALKDHETYNREHKMSFRDRMYFDDDFAHEWGIVAKLYSSDKSDFKKNITSFLAREKIAKYDELINKVEDYIGDITGTELLFISEKGELNGIIEGTKGKVELATIGAGGYNIQRFHYRVLLHQVR